MMLYQSPLTATFVNNQRSHFERGLATYSIEGVFSCIFDCLSNCGNTVAYLFKQA